MMEITYQNGICLYLEQLRALGIDRLYISEETLRQSLPASRQELLDRLYESIKDCRLCRLCEGRTQVVFGAGNPDAELVFVGEGPGADEDAQGIPFVGRAGKLLTDMIQKGMRLKRGDVYICNVVKCRPPGNRTPLLDEAATCEPFLFQQLEIIRPKYIVALGKPAAQSLLRTQAPISRLRGHWHEFRGIKVMPTYHPAYLLRSPEAKREVWEDLQKVMKEMGLPVKGP